VKTPRTVAVFSGAAMSADDRGGSEIKDDDKIASEYRVVLGDQSVPIAVGVVGVQRCRRVEVGQEPRLPLGSRTVQHVAHPLANAGGWPP